MKFYEKINFISTNDTIEESFLYYVTWNGGREGDSNNCRMRCLYVRFLLFHIVDFFLHCFFYFHFFGLCGLSHVGKYFLKHHIGVPDLYEFGKQYKVLFRLSIVKNKWKKKWTKKAHNSKLKHRTHEHLMGHLFWSLRHGNLT